MTYTRSDINTILVTNDKAVEREDQTVRTAKLR